MESESSYIHGTSESEQERLALLNRLSNPPFLEFLNLRGDERVLEVGSGLGILTADAAARLESGFAVGVEYSRDQLAAACPGERVQFCRGDAHRLPYSDSRFDVVYCRYLLEHVPDPVRVLREM